jgi:hypothetical protein
MPKRGRVDAGRIVVSAVSTAARRPSRSRAADRRRSGAHLRRDLGFIDKDRDQPNRRWRESAHRLCREKVAQAPRAVRAQVQATPPAGPVLVRTQAARAGLRPWPAPPLPRP